MWIEKVSIDCRRSTIGLLLLPPPMLDACVSVLERGEVANGCCCDSVPSIGRLLLRPCSPPIIALAGGSSRLAPLLLTRRVTSGDGGSPRNALSAAVNDSSARANSASTASAEPPLCAASLAPAKWTSP